MTIMKKTIQVLLAGMVMLSPSVINAQEFAIKTVELTNDQVLLYYDLTDTTKNRTYSVFVYSSRDNFLSPLAKIAGDAGIEVKPGLNRKIAWNMREELGNAFDGEVELEIRGRMYVPFIRFVGFEDVEVRKRKTPFIVKWSGGTRQNILNFQLYKKASGGDKLVYTFPNAPNENEYKLELPTSVRPGKDYYFRISDSKNKDQVVLTPDFIVKRKVPLLLKVLPIAVVGYAAYFLLSKADDGPKELEPAPGTPEN